MKLKRYTINELQELLPQVFLDYMIDEGVNEVHEQYLDKIREYEGVAELYRDSLAKGELENSTEQSIKEQLDYLRAGLKHLKSCNMSYQKDLYKETGSVDFCRSIVQIPLNKKIKFTRFVKNKLFLIIHILAFLVKSFSAFFLFCIQHAA